MSPTITGGVTQYYGNFGSEGEQNFLSKQRRLSKFSVSSSKEMVKTILQLMVVETEC